MLRHSTPDQSALRDARVVFVLSFMLLGVLVGHDLSYRLAGMSTGGSLAHAHAYLGPLGKIAPIGIFVGLALALRAYFRMDLVDGWLQTPAVAARRRHTLLAVALPYLSFVTMETAERIMAHVAPVPPLHLLLVGLVVQGLLGLLCLTIVRFTLRATARIALALKARVPDRLGRRFAALRTASSVLLPHSLRLTGAVAGRAPPVAAL